MGVEWFIDFKLGSKNGLKKKVKFLFLNFFCVQYDLHHIVIYRMLNLTSFTSSKNCNLI